MRKISHSEVMLRPNDIGDYWMSSLLFEKYWGYSQVRIQQVFEGTCGNIAEYAFGAYPQLTIQVILPS